MEAEEPGGAAAAERGDGSAGDQERIEELSRRLARSERERQLFGDIVSHDLLNPVWVAENYLRIALEEPDAARARGFLEGAQGAFAKTRGILLDARTYLRLRDGRDFHRELLDAAALVEAAAKGVRPLWESRGQTVAFEVPADARVHASPLLREVVANLLSNAVKYAPPGSPIEVVLRPGPPLRLEVGDRGPGVPEDARNLIFERFERIEKGAISGVGLGLPIARRIVEFHGGRLWVEDNPGGGARFIAEVPV